MYKTSFYNLFVPYKDKVVYANLLQESSFLLTPSEDERIQQQLSDLISFELGYPSVLHIRSRITLSFNYTDGGANAIEQILQKKNSMEDQLDKPGFRMTDPLQAGAGWRYPADEHYYVRTVFPDGTFYIGKQDAFIPTLLALGKLDIKTGELTGDEIQEYRATNLNWFETQQCRSCRLLPAIYPVCSRACRQTDPALVRSVCPLERKAFGEDDFVVLLFEQKETLIRQLMAK